jgi:tetratricopeptide (TPR) repeat protein
VKRTRTSLVFVAWVLLAPGGAGAQGSAPEEVSPRIARFEAWLKAVDQHRPGVLDEAVRLIGTWNQEQLLQIWMDVLTIVSLVREPGVSIFFVTEPGRVGANTRQISPMATNRSRQVLYTVGELRHLRGIVKRVSPTASAGPENRILKRGAMLHTDIEILGPSRKDGSASDVRPGPGGTTLLMNDGQQLGLMNAVSHWNMGRRLLDAVRPPDSKNGLKTRPDPAADDTVRRWYLAGGAFMLRTRFVEPHQFSRALELFPNDPEVLFLVAAAHEYFAGVRTQSVMRSLKAPRDVSFDIQEEGAELRLAEQLYKRALERSPGLIEARVRLGRVLGRRGRHEEAIAQLQQGRAAGEPLVRFYAHLFLGGEFEAVGKGAEARESYERATAIAPTAQSPLLALSRLADQAGDRTAAREWIARLLKLPAQDEERADPWWVYEIVPARAVDGLLADVRQRVASMPE